VEDPAGRLSLVIAGFEHENRYPTGHNRFQIQNAKGQIVPAETGQKESRAQLPTCGLAIPKSG
jgi:hypothetical protein